MTPEYPYDTPIRDLLVTAVDPDPAGGLLDGVTPEQLAAARIAKHKEILTPPVEPPATRAMTQATMSDFATVRAEVALTREVLADIRGVLQDILDELKPKRGQRD